MLRINWHEPISELTSQLTNVMSRLIQRSYILTRHVDLKYGQN